MQKPCMRFETQYVFDLVHIDPCCRYAVSQRNLWRSSTSGDEFTQHHHSGVRHRSGIVTRDSTGVTAHSGYTTKIGHV